MPANHMDDTLRKQRAAQASKRGAESRQQAEHMEDEINEVQAGDFWKEPSNLETPPARPGYVQRWVRTSIRSEPDAGNEAKARRKGYLPRMADTAPDFPAPTIKHGTMAGAIASVDCVLFERPIALDRQEKNAQQARTGIQMNATVGMLQQNEHKAMPFEMESRSKVSRGGSRIPKAADDLEGHD